MAKKINFSLIKNAADLVTPREKTRAGFIALALGKSYLAVPYVEEAKALKAITNRVKKPFLIRRRHEKDLQKLCRFTADWFYFLAVLYYRSRHRQATVEFHPRFLPALYELARV